jgi:acyl carrier protein
MPDPALEEGVRAVVAELAELDEDAIGFDTPFAEADIDSLLAMEIAVHVEARFGVRFAEADVKAVRTISDLAVLVERQRTPAG